MDMWRAGQFLAALAPALVLPGWFWPHCARPALRARGARPLAYRLTLGSITVTVAVQVFEMVLIARGVGWSPLGAVVLVGANLPFFIIVAFGYLFDQDATLVRLTGGPLPRYGLAPAVDALVRAWRAIDDPPSSEQLAQLGDLLGATHKWRAPETAELIDAFDASIGAYLADVPMTDEEFDARLAVLEPLMRTLWSVEQRSPAELGSDDTR